MTWRTIGMGMVLAVTAGCGDTAASSGGKGESCDPDVGVLCICPGPAIGERECDGGTPGACDCSDPLTPGECTEDSSAAACICDDNQIGEQSCVDGQAGDCICPDPIPPEQCRTDLDCDDGSYCNGVERCDPDADNANARGCTSADSARTCDDGIACTSDRCSDELNRCVFEAPDKDNDGHADASCLGADDEPLGDDCDDADGDNYPGNQEICSEGNFTHDEDCDGTTFGQLDLDADGDVDARCCNGSNCGGDCDDTTIARRTGQPEFCDKTDNDCDGIVDEETGAIPWYVDNDGDGFGSADIEAMGGPIDRCIPIPGRSLIATDCDDDDASKHPAQLERCDLRDNNCNLIADEGAGCPYEGFPVGPDGVGGVDVPDTGGITCPGFGFEDMDGDGYGANATAVALDPSLDMCGLPTGWVTKSDDCDDGNSSANPGMIDVCDRVDNDCDDSVDEEPEATESCDVANVEAMCDEGDCKIKTGAVCNAPFDDCDGVQLNGCETDTRSSTLHCGACNQPCALGDVCEAGSCAVSPYLGIVTGSLFKLVHRAGGVLGWGESANLQLGTGGDILNPMLLSLVGPVTQLTAGARHICARRGGSVSCWGDNEFGQLGIGVVAGPDMSLPTPVTGIDDATLVRGGNVHTCVIRADQTVWCWGNAAAGQLGNPDAMLAGTEAPLPVQVQGISDAVDLGLGISFSCVLHGTTATVSCFGSDADGRTGSIATGGDDNIFLPVEIPGLSNVRSLATGSSVSAYMCAVLNSGGVVCWGNNDWGQLGNGTQTATTSPTTFQGVSDVREVSIGFSVTCALENDGDVWCAGGNELKQVAQGSGTAYYPTPVQIDLGEEPAASVACSNAGCCALLDKGNVLCWGYNSNGQVGNGMSSPVGVWVPYETLPVPQ